jgi:hypothetical protein
VTLADQRRTMERMMKGNRKKPKRSRKPYWEMTTAELRKATKEFDREFIGETFRPVTPQELARFERARKRGRSRNGLGAKTISVTVENRLLAQTDRWPRSSKFPAPPSSPADFKPWSTRNCWCSVTFRPAVWRCVPFVPYLLSGSSR